MKTTLPFIYAVVTVLAATAASAFHVSVPQSPTAQARSTPPAPPRSPLNAAAPIVIAALIFSFAPQSMAVDGDVTKGKAIFTSTCAGCHLGGQNFVKEKKTLKKDALEKFVGLDQGKVESFFKGSLQHKIIGGKLSDQDITDVTTFVVDQAQNEKW